MRHIEKKFSRPLRLERFSASLQSPRRAIGASPDDVEDSSGGTSKSKAQVAACPWSPGPNRGGMGIRQPSKTFDARTCRGFCHAGEDVANRKPEEDARSASTSAIALLLADRRVRGATRLRCPLATGSKILLRHRMLSVLFERSPRGVAAASSIREGQIEMAERS